MKSKTSFFNSSLFWNFNKRHWPLWFVYLACMVVAVILPLAMFGGRELANSYISFGTIPFAFVLAFAAAFFAFKHLSSSTASVFYCSLPTTRSGVFTTMFLAGFLPLIACNAVIVLVGLIASIGKFAVGAMALLAWFAMMSMADLIFYAMAVLCMQLTGISWMGGVLYVAANFIVTAIEAMVVGVLNYYIYGASFTEAFFQWASPLVEISWTSTVAIASGKVYTAGWLDMIIYSAFAIVCIIVAAVLYKRRKFERVSELIAYKGLRPVFKYLMAIFFALGIGTLLFQLCFTVEGTNMTMSMTLALVGFMIIGGVLGYIGTSMLVKKLARVSKGDMVGAAIVAVCCLAFGLSCHTDLLGVESRVPDVSKIESIQVTSNGYGFDGSVNSEMLSSAFTTEEGIESVTDAHRAIIADHDNGLIGEIDPYEGIIWAEGETPTEGFSNVTIQYTMKSGYTFTRSYGIYGSTELFDDKDSCLAKLAKVCDSKEARESRYALITEMAEHASDECTIEFMDADTGNSSSLYISPKKVRELVNGPLKKDISAADGCGCDLRSQFEKWYANYSEDEMYLSIYTNDSNYAAVVIDKDRTPNTYKWVQEYENPSH